MTILKVFILKCEKQYIFLHVPRQRPTFSFNFFLKFANKFILVLWILYFFFIFIFLSVEETRREVEMITYHFKTKN